MQTRSGLIGPALLLATLLLGGAGVARAGGEPGGDITFRLVLRGDVIAGDNFTLAVNDLGPTGLIISPGVRCGPDAGVLTDPFAPCQPGTYDFVLPGMAELPIGNPLEYTWARNYGAETDRHADIVYSDTITVTENAQVLTVVYDYAGGAQLPNTAMSAPVPGVPFGLALISAGIAVLAYAWRRPIRTS